MFDPRQFPGLSAASLTVLLLALGTKANLTGQTNALNKKDEAPPCGLPIHAQCADEDGQSIGTCESTICAYDPVPDIQYRCIYAPAVSLF